MTPNYRKNLIEFTLGADPELAATDKRGQTIVARDQLGTNGKFGYDGHSTTFELRPDATPCPLQLTQNIRKLFVDAFEKNPKFYKWNWLAGSHAAGQNLGGHVHFGLKKSIIEPVEASSYLSQYLGAICLLLEDPEGAKRRRGSYGHMEDHRPQEWGFEYRTLSSWLTSPAVAAGVLCTAKTVMDEMVNNTNFRPGYYVFNSTFQHANVNQVRSKYDNIWSDLTQMRLYPKYKKYINVLDMLVRRKATWFHKDGLKNAWGLVDTRVVSGNEITLDTIWGDVLAPKKRKVSIGLSYNDSFTVTAESF